MFINFISIGVEEEDFDDIEEFFKYTQKSTPTVRKPVTVKADSVLRFEPSIYDPEWTDVFTSDGDIIVAEMSYTRFKQELYTALDFSVDATWEVKESTDKELVIRLFKN